MVRRSSSSRGREDASDDLWALLGRLPGLAGKDLSLHLQSPETPARGSLPPGSHLHDTWELKIVLEGTLRCPLEGGGASVRGPAVVLVPPARIHRASLRGDLGRSLKMISLGADDARPPYMVLHRLRPATNRPMSRVQLPGEVLQQWHQRLGCRWTDFLDTAMRNCAQESNTWPGDPGSYRRHGILFLISALLMAQAEAKDATSAAASLVERAEDVMRQHYYDASLSVPGVARAVHRTPTYLASLFRRERGYTVRQALVRIRLDRAHALLQRGQYAVKEVAHLTGWSSQQYFANCFRRVYGYPPSSVLAMITPPAGSM